MRVMLSLSAKPKLPAFLNAPFFDRWPQKEIDKLVKEDTKLKKNPHAKKALEKLQALEPSYVTIPSNQDDCPHELYAFWDDGKLISKEVSRTYSKASAFACHWVSAYAWMKDGLRMVAGFAYDRVGHTWYAHTFLLDEDGYIVEPTKSSIQDDVADKYWGTVLTDAQAKVIAKVLLPQFADFDLKVTKKMLDKLK